MNTPLILEEDCGMTYEDLESRRSLKKLKPEAITAAELGQAVVVQDHLVLPGLPEDAPAWGQALHQGLQVIADAVSANAQAIAANAQAIASIDLRLSALARNSRIRSYNSRRRNDGGDLIALMKENSIPSGNLLGMMVVDPELSGLPVNSTPPQQLFPDNLNQLERLSDERISQLMSFYNDDFGITLVDNLSAKRKKFKGWIS